jgi:hypothetical protein
MKTILNSKEDIINYLQNYYQLYNEIPKCNSKLHPFTKYQINKLFKNWSNVLILAKIPLRLNPPKLVICLYCKKKFIKKFSQIKLNFKNYCSKLCYHNSTISIIKKEKFSIIIDGKIIYYDL